MGQKKRDSALDKRETQLTSSLYCFFINTKNNPKRTTGISYYFVQVRVPINSTDKVSYNNEFDDIDSNNRNYQKLNYCHFLYSYIFLITILLLSCHFS